MLISARHRFIFVHIPKTDGSSVTSALMPYAAGGGRQILEFGVGRRVARGLAKRGIAYVHPRPFRAHIRAAKLARKIGPRRFDSFFTFAFVRNPWDWHVSFYSYVRANPSHRYPGPRSSFEEYLRWRCGGRVVQQADYVYDRDRLLVDVIGRYETIRSDFARICERLGIRWTLPQTNASPRGSYQDYHTPETRDQVSRTFATDIERFGYSFESG